MKLKKLLWLLLPAALLALLRRAFAKGATVDAPAPAPSAAARSDRFAPIDAYLERELARLRMPGAVLAIVAGDQIVHTRGFGRARPGGEVPTAQTPFFIGSLTKSFTALAVMQLVEAGKVDLDAPVQRYLPWFRVADPAASARITVRHLLNQTSGLPGLAGEIPQTDDDWRADAGERQARALATTRLNHPPGSAMEYSNANYDLLGLVVAAAAGQPYAAYLQEHILDPLGMAHTHTMPSSAQADWLAVGHRYWFGRPVPAPDLPTPLGSLASGQLISSAEDMARYLIAMLNGGRAGDTRLLSEAGIAELQRGAAAFNVYGMALGQYGMGWFVDQLGAQKLVWHGGTNPHFGAYMALLPERRQGVVLLCSGSHHWYNPVQAELGTGVTALLAGAEHKPVPFVPFIPWLLRAQPLVPLLQLAVAAATLRRPARRPPSPRAWAQFLLPLVPNLLLASTLRSILGRRGPYLRLYMPDSWWLALVSGSFGLAWSLLRAALLLRALRRPATARAASKAGG